VVYTQTGPFVLGRKEIFEMEPSSSEAKPNVLVVDDNESIREVLTILLSHRGYQCESATNGIDAMQKVKQSNFDAVITDLEMPKMDGIVLTRELSLHFSDLSVMVMTGCSDESIREKAFLAGAKEFVTKPFNVPDLVTRLQRMLLIRKSAEYHQV
jgi:CheY-like chemotaxis protein